MLNKEDKADIGGLILSFFMLTATIIASGDCHLESVIKESACQCVQKMGITSCDSATASFGVGFNRGLMCRTDKRKTDAVTFQLAGEMLMHQDEIDVALGVMPDYERVPAKLKRRFTE